MTYKGGKTYLAGYELTRKPHHPFAVNGYVRTHRLVWEEANNAILLPWIDIDHKNKNRLDNRIENLRPMTRSQHTSMHNTKDMSKRHCHVCGYGTIKTKRGFYDWYKLGENFICNKCYFKIKRGSLVVAT